MCDDVLFVMMCGDAVLCYAVLCMLMRYVLCVMRYGGLWCVICDGALRAVIRDVRLCVVYAMTVVMRYV